MGRNRHLLPRCRALRALVQSTSDIDRRTPNVHYVPARKSRRTLIRIIASTRQRAVRTGIFEQGIRRRVVGSERIPADPVTSADPKRRRSGRMNSLLAADSESSQWSIRLLTHRGQCDRGTSSCLATGAAKRSFIVRTGTGPEIVRPSATGLGHRERNGRGSSHLRQRRTHQACVRGRS